jgi:hypothetical protein
MDLNDLHLTPQRQQELQQLLDRAHDNYTTDLENLADAATNEMETLLQRNPLDARELVEEYARDASQLANDYYDDLRTLWQQYGGVEFPDFGHADLIDPDRAMWQVQGGFNNSDYAGLTYKQVKEDRSRAGKKLTDLWPSFANVDDSQQFVADMINASARLTMQRNMRLDPSKPRWARVPRGATTCAFCTMLASRGFAYLSEESAGLEMQYHKDCDCQIIPSWGKQSLKGYDPDAMYEMWQQAGADGGDYRDKLKRMRRQHPDSLTDGVRKISESQPEPFPDTSEEYDMLDEWMSDGYINIRKAQNGNTTFTTPDMIAKFQRQANMMETMIGDYSTNKTVWRGLKLDSRSWREDLNLYEGAELNEHALASWSSNALTSYEFASKRASSTEHPVLLVNRSGGRHMMSTDSAIGEKTGEWEYISSGRNRYRVVSIKDVNPATLDKESAELLSADPKITLVEVEQL